MGYGIVIISMFMNVKEVVLKGKGSEKMTKEEVINFIIQYSGVEDVEVTDDMNLFKDLKYDSLKFIEFVAAVEECMGKEFDDMSILFDKLESVGELCEYILDEEKCCR